MQRKNKKLTIILLSILLVLIIVSSSLLAVVLSANTNRKTVSWIGKMIEQYYYPPLPEKFENFVARYGTNPDYNALYQGINNELLDKYSRFYTKEEYQAQQQTDSGQNIGAGLTFKVGTNILARIPIGSPLFFANTGDTKIEVGMALTQVGNIAVQNFQDIQAAMQGYTVNSNMTLTFTAPESTQEQQANTQAKNTNQQNAIWNTKLARERNTVTVTVQARAYTESYLLYSCNQRAYAYLYPNSITSAGWTDITEYTPQTDLMTQTGVAYFKLSSFMGESNKEFDYAMEQYKKDNATTLLLDLRNNGGGYVSHMADISKYFLKNGEEKGNVVMTAKFKDGSEQNTVVNVNKYNEYLANSKIRVLANQNSASASEALIGVLISYGAVSYKDIFITEIDGVARTYGKGIMQSTFVHPFAGYAIKLTTAQIYWKNGTTIHGEGIIAGDSEMQATISGQYSPFAYGDPELKAVLQRI